MEQALTRTLSGWAKTAFAQWSALTAVGSFLLYLFGYLSFRFHLSALGIVTGLNVLDERYFFGGARFVIHLLALLPFAVVLLILFRWSFRAVLALFAKRLPAATARLLDWWNQPAPPLYTSVTFCLAAIQLVLIRCFEFTNLVFRRELPSDNIQARFIASMLRAENLNLIRAFEVTGLALCLIAGILLVVIYSRSLEKPWHILLRNVSLVLFALMVLLLPVNHGMVIAPFEAHLSHSIGSQPVPEGQCAWLIADDKQWIHYVVTSTAGSSLVAVPASELKRFDLRARENLVSVLFPRTVPRLPCSPSFPAPSPAEAPSTSSRAGHKPAPPNPRQPETLASRLAAFIGFSISPRDIKGDDEPAEPGQIWRVNLDNLIKPDAHIQLTTHATFSSPVFQPGSQAIFALRGSDELVAIDSVTKEITSVGRISGVRKLVGFNAGHPSQLLLVLAAPFLRPSVLDLEGGGPGLLPEPSSEEAWILPHLLSWQRVYGGKPEIILSVRDRNYGRRKGTDVFISSATEPVTYCEGDLCSQPSLASNSKDLVYIRTPRP